MVVLAVLGSIALFVVIGLNHWRAARRLSSEVHLLASAPRLASQVISEVSLPPVVERYRQLSVRGHEPVRTVRMRHGGTFQTSPKAAPRPIRGEQWFTADPPGFVWSARVRIAPAVWIRARDMSVAGKGAMRVEIDDTITLANARGPRFDQGDALRLLAEMVWFPTALFDQRTVSWSAIDATHARATLRLADVSVSGVFEFGADGLPVGMTAERYNDRGELCAWGGVYHDWRTVEGMRIPFRAEVAWQTTPPFVYARWRVESIAYDRVEQSATSRWAGWAIALELLLGVGAIGGGSALMIGPNGEILPLPVAALADSPFASYFVPGAILFVLLGVAPIVAAVLSIRDSSVAPLMAFAIGAALVVWICVEIAIVGYSNHPPLQLAYLVLGVAIAVIAMAWIREARSARPVQSTDAT